ncbi:hypothetical protein F2Q68_00024947 [Brassica cretica]|uniref:Uncharacterized protein n=1 Tax=Brassica cretica TaxID=69181 RepID=A0A8S9IDU1_BRACR|nr:hypothetical protein F2Q68_00024947 [Brassica cretica]
MDSSATVPFGSPPLPPEPPDPDLVVVFPINPPDPPPVLLVCPFLRQISPSYTDPLNEKEIESLMPWELCSSTGCLLKPLCSYVDVLSTGISPSGALNSGRCYSSFRHYPVSKPIIITSCVEHVLLKSALRASTIYHKESCVVSLSFARLLVSIAECKLTSLQYSSLQSLEDWAWKVEILVVIFSLFAALNTSMQHFEVELSTALCSSQSRPIFSCFKLLLGMVFLISWSESRLFDPCLLVDLSYLSRNPILHRNEEVLLSWISSVPHFEDVTLPLSFRLKLSLPQYEEVTRCVSRLWWFSSQLSVSSKRCLVAFEIVAGSFLIGYFQICSANGMWMEARVLHRLLSGVCVGSGHVVKAVMIHKASQLAISIGLSRLQILPDSIAPFSAMRLGLDLNEITGFLSFKNILGYVYYQLQLHVFCRLEGNPNLCTLSSCKPKEKTKFLLPTIASAASLVVMVVVAFIFVFLKKKVPLGESSATDH